MIEILTNEEFEKMKASGKILQEVFKTCRDFIKPGVSTHDVDKLCYDIIRSHDAIPSFLNFGQPPFPGTICASVNDEVVHGIPKKNRILQDGDIISVDVGAILAYEPGMGPENTEGEYMRLARFDHVDTKLVSGDRKSVV